jgi:glycolate oxidase
MRIRREGVNPLILEYADKYGIEAANKVKGFHYPETEGGMVLVDVDGPKGGTNTMREKVVRIMNESHATRIVSPSTPTEYEDITDVSPLRALEDSSQDS